MPKTIGIVGSRKRDTHGDYAKCLGAFKKIYEPGDRIVSGGCKDGGDAFAEEIAKKEGVTITIHHPSNQYPYPARYFVRNAEIAKDCDVLIALVDDDRAGGTEYTVNKAIELGKQIIYA